MSNDKAIIDRQAAQIAMLREALHVGRALTMGYINGALTEKSKDEAIADLQIINAALTATAADVEAWQAAQAAPPASPTPLKQHSRFTCPKCGSHKFGTSIHGDNSEDWVGHCDFRVDDDIGCQFSWPRTDDHLYFTAP